MYRPGTHLPGSVCTFNVVHLCLTPATDLLHMLQVKDDDEEKKEKKTKKVKEVSYAHWLPASLSCHPCSTYRRCCVACNS